MKQDTLPKGMVLVETADGRWCPAFALFLEIPLWVHILEGPLLIPPARDIYYDSAQSYGCREEAIEVCHAWREAVELTEEWRGLAAHTELYPERTAWYRDEIIHLAGGDDSPHLHCGSSVQAVVLARGNDGIEVITATGNTPDEAIETLYQRVYEWSRKQQTLACVNSLRSN